MVPRTKNCIMQGPGVIEKEGKEALHCGICSTKECSMYKALLDTSYISRIVRIFHPWKGS